MLITKVNVNIFVLRSRSHFMSLLTITWSSMPRIGICICSLPIECWIACNIELGG
ncbi:hypothetical protein FHR25_005006 [Yokenella regensburgei]|jgi:hypothetical protein|nr:hypothetical protein FHR25_005006 [Yokenella regensburgei]